MKMLPAWSESDEHGVDGFAANPCLDAEPTASHKRAQDGGHVGAQYAKRGACEDGEGNAIARSRVRVQQHRDEYEHVAEKNGEERLLPVHAAGNHAARKHVRGDVHAHGNPESGVGVSAPGAAFRRDWSEVLVIERAAANSFGSKRTCLQVTHLECPCASAWIKF